MNARALIVAASFFIAMPALAGDPSTTGSLATPANRVVGLWSNESVVGPCGAVPTQHGHNTVAFNAGGTLVDNFRAAAGAPVQRSIGLGTWAYSPRTGDYTQRVQFDWYLNGAYDGYQTVDRNFTISSDGKHLSGAVVTTRYNADDSTRAQLCGSATSTRL